DHITILVVGSTVNKLDVLELGNCNRSFWQRSQPGQMIPVEVLAIPQCSQTGHRIKSLERVQPSHYLVVVAANKGSSQLASSIGHFVWAGTVTDDIAQIDHGITGRSLPHAGFQRFQVTVNVTKQEYAQSAPERDYKTGRQGWDTTIGLH